MEQQIPHYAPIMGDTEYFLLLLCMAAIIAALFLWRQKISGGLQLKNVFNQDKNDTIQIIAQKPIDLKTRLVIFQTKEYRYIVLLGQNHALLIDKTPNPPQKDFNQVLNQESK